MKKWHGSRVHDSIIKMLEKQEKYKSLKGDRFFKYKLTELQNRLTQELLINKIVETENPAALTELIGKGFRKLVRSTEFEFRYFVAPVRNIVPQPNPYSLFMTQYIIEELIKDPNIIDVYGTDDEIYRLVDKIITQISDKFEREEQEILKQLANQKNLIPGSRAYEVALENMMRQAFGDPQKI